MSSTHLQSIPDDELIRRLTDILQQSRRIESELVAHIGEVDERKLYAREACSSMFSYCTDVLHLSEAEAYMRIGVARASRRYPRLLDMLANGRLHLSGASKLLPHLTEENCESLLDRAAHKSKRQIEELIAEIAPKPDAPAVARKLPAAAPPPPQLRPDGVKNEMRPATTPPARSTPPPVVEPLAPARYKIQFTASASFRDKLERLQALMHEDLATVIESAVTEKLERLEAKRFAETKAPRKSLEETDTSRASRYVPAPVKRAVRERDGDQCAFVDSRGSRCRESRELEFHHDRPFALGGDHSPENVYLMCRTHNAYFAERAHGKDAMSRFRVREPAVTYGAEAGI